MSAKFCVRSLVAVLLVPLLVSGVRAADVKWSGDASFSDDWGNGTNWLNGTPAGPFDAAIFPYIGIPGHNGTSYNVNLNGDRTVDSISFTERYAYTLSNNTLTAGVFVTTSPVATAHTINSNVAIPAFGDFIINVSGLTINGVVSGSSGFQKRGSSWLNLSGANTFSGGVFIREGSLGVNTDSNLGAAGSPVTFQGGSLSLNDVSAGSFLNRPLITDGGDAIIHANSGPYTFYHGISGDKGLVKNGAGILIFRTTSATFTGNVTINDGILATQLSDFIPDAADVNITSASGTFRMQGLVNATETIGSLSGMGTVAFVGTGQNLRIGANNNDSTYNGTILSSSGGDAHITKIGTGKLTLGGNNTYTEGTTVDGGTLQLGNGGTAGSILGDVVNNATLAFNRSDDLTFSGLISGTGGVTKLGGNTLTLNAANTYTGGTTLNGGTLSLANSSAAGTGGITVLGSTIDYANTVNIANTIDLQSDVTLNVSTGEATQSGIIGQTGGTYGVTKTGDGTLTLSGTNTYSGGTTVDQGILRVLSDDSLGANTGAVTLNEATLMNSDSIVNLHASRTLTLGSSWGAIRAGWTYKDITVSGKITGSGELRISNDSSTVILANSTNDYTGNTVIGDAATGHGPATRATLRLGASNVIPTASQIVFNGGAGVTGTWDMNGFSESIRGLLVDSGSAEISNLGAGASTLTVGTADTTSTYTGLIKHDIALVKTGTGSLTLSGANTYFGGTTIAAGTLLANNTTGSATGTGKVQVDDGATLGGTGSVGGAVSINSGGTVAPGASVGQLTVGSIQLKSGSLFDIELAGSGGVAGTDFDQLLVTGNATLGGDLTIDLLDGFIPSETDSFTILTSSILSGSFGNIADGARLATVAGTADFLVNYDGITNTVVLSDFAPILDGDINIDGFVDAADAGIMFGNWGPTTLGYFSGNLNGDEYIDAADAGIMFANWTGDTGPISATIPEPTTQLLASLAGSMLLQRRRRI